MSPDDGNGDGGRVRGRDEVGEGVRSFKDRHALREGDSGLRASAPGASPLPSPRDMIIDFFGVFR